MESVERSGNTEKTGEDNPDPDPVAGRPRIFTGRGRAVFIPMEAGRNRPLTDAATFL